MKIWNGTGGDEMACCKDCGWSEIIGSPIICHYTGHRTFRDECCEAWKPKEEEKPDMVEVVRCKDCKFWYKDECSHLCAITGDLRPGGWFCADGERKC